MRSILSLGLGLISFVSLFFLIESFLFKLNSIGLWGPLLFCIFMLGHYIMSAVPAVGTISASRSKKWPIIVLYIFQVVCSIALIVSLLATEGFALFYLIPFGSIGFLAVGSILKCLSNQQGYDVELKQLQQEATYFNWSAEDFLNRKEMLDRTYTSTSKFGFIVLIISIILSWILLNIFF